MINTINVCPLLSRLGRPSSFPNLKMGCIPFGYNHKLAQLDSLDRMYGWTNQPLQFSRIYVALKAWYPKRGEMLKGEFIQEMWLLHMVQDSQPNQCNFSGCLNWLIGTYVWTSKLTTVIFHDVHNPLSLRLNNGRDA